MFLSTGAHSLSPGHGGYSASSTPCPESPASSVGLAVKPTSCAWLLGLLETLWEKLCLGLHVLSCPQGRQSEASSLPVPFVDLIHHVTSPQQHEHPHPSFQDPAKKSDNIAIGAWGEGGGSDRPGFLSLGIPCPLCVPSAFELHVV